nr:MAG TPA: hypothetical protein [Caudoviricetes sp.]
MVIYYIHGTRIPPMELYLEKGSLLWRTHSLYSWS